MPVPVLVGEGGEQCVEPARQRYVDDRQEDGREHVPHLDLLPAQPQHVYGDGHDERAAHRSHLRDDGRGEIWPHPARQQCDPALVNQQGDRREQHADPHRGGEGDGGHPVDDPFRDDDLIVMVQPRLDGSGDGHRPYAEQQGGVHEALSEAAAALFLDELRPEEVPRVFQT